MRKTILVVDDGEAVRSLVCRMLVQSGYRVLEARDGHHALRLCEAHLDRIHLVLTDVVMPNMKGAELAERLRRIRPDLPILLMSGYTGEPALQGVNRGSVAFLEKPFTSVSLAEKVRQVLDAPHG
ncbi:MAG TPA: response regulator [Bryobacteraceae bacterium]|nr:response regulator [Bryobacteraceae bacterium]